MKDQYQENLFAEEKYLLDKSYIKTSFFTHLLIYPGLLFFPIKLNYFVISLALSITVIRLIGFFLFNHKRALEYYLNISAISIVFIFNLFFWNLDVGKIKIEHFFSGTVYYLLSCLVIIIQSMRLSFLGIWLTTLFSCFTYYITQYLHSTQFHYSKSLDDYFYTSFIFIIVGIITSTLYRNRLKAVLSNISLTMEKQNINRDMILARSLQESLFPSDRKLNHLRYEVFRKSQILIGGDFYDFIQLREGNVGIFLADVAGHGIASAMIASVLKVMVSTMPYILKLDPENFLTYIDEKLSKEFNSHHATAVYLYINFLSNEFIFANAGHPYLLYCPRGGEFKEIYSSGTMLGFQMRKPVAENIRCSFNKGDRFVIYTDGIIECTNEKEEQLTSTGLMEILNLYRDRNISDIKKNLILDVLSFQGKNDFLDDAMFLIFEIE